MTRKNFFRKHRKAMNLLICIISMVISMILLFILTMICMTAWAKLMMETAPIMVALSWIIIPACSAKVIKIVLGKIVDTYFLVEALQNGGFSTKQVITFLTNK